MKKFFRNPLLASVLAVLCLSMVVLPIQGCTDSQVVSEINTVLTEATNVLVVVSPNAPWVSQMQAAVTALKTAEASWQSGGAVQNVIDALNTLEAITAVIPLTATYSPLIDVLVAGIEAVLVALPTSTKVSVRAVTPNPHFGRVLIKHRFAHSQTKEFKDAWNAAAKANPALAGATIN